MNIELLLEGLTWGDLRAFVALSDAPDEDKVAFEHDDDFAPRSMFVTGFDPKRVRQCERDCRNDAEED